MKHEGFKLKLVVFQKYGFKTYWLNGSNWSFSEESGAIAFKTKKAARKIYGLVDFPKIEKKHFYLIVGPKGGTYQLSK